MSLKEMFKMKKTYIITLNGYFNYGNRLQNYALEKVLKKKQIYPITLIIEKFNKNEKLLSKIKRIKLNNFLTKIFNQFFFIGQKLIKLKYKNIINKKTTIFKRFSKEFLNEKPFNQPNENSYFIAGSDQIWNPHYNSDFKKYFLQFAPKDKRIAYAPSFGVSEIPEDKKEKYKKWLNEIPHLSVREKEGAKIIKELTGRDVPVLVDPTLLLKKEEWLEISKEHENKPKSKYLLTYFLGTIPRDRKKLIKNIAKKYHLKIVRLADLKDKKTYTADPSEFIDYINSAEIFLTDSFHGTVFSILMETPFYVFQRLGGKSMYSRIDTLLEMTNFKNREEKDINLSNNLLEVDFAHVDEILKKERQKSMDFLKNALNTERQ
jgi:hypothetical protein